MERHVLIAYRIHAMVVFKIIKLLLSRKKKFLSSVDTKSLQKWILPSPIVVSVPSTWHFLGLLNFMFLYDSLCSGVFSALKQYTKKEMSP